MTEKLTEEFIRENIGHWYRHKGDQVREVLKVTDGGFVIFHCDTAKDVYIHEVDRFIEFNTYIGSTPEPEFPCEVEERFIPIWETSVGTAYTGCIYRSKEAAIESAQNRVAEGLRYGYHELDKAQWVGRRGDDLVVSSGDCDYRVV